LINFLSCMNNCYLICHAHFTKKKKDLKGKLLGFPRMIGIKFTFMILIRVSQNLKLTRKISKWLCKTTIWYLMIWWGIQMKFTLTSLTTNIITILKTTTLLYNRSKNIITIFIQEVMKLHLRIKRQLSTSQIIQIIAWEIVIFNYSSSLIETHSKS